MKERRATDILWRELRGALLNEARGLTTAAGRRILIDEGHDSALRLQDGERCLDIRASREVVNCTVLNGSDPESRKELPILLYPGASPPFKLNGTADFADGVARKLLQTLLERES